MSIIDEQDEFIFSTSIGTMKCTLKKIRRYDVEDIIADRALSQANQVRFIFIGEQIDINTPKGSRTIESNYFRSRGIRNG